MLIRKMLLLVFIISILNAKYFGTILSNAIILNQNRLTKRDESIIQKIHSDLLITAKNRMSRDIKAKGEDLVIKFFRRNEPDSALEEDIADATKTIIIFDKQNDADIKDTNMNNFKDFTSITDYDPVGTMVLLIEKIKKYYGFTGKYPFVSFYYGKDEEKKVPLRAIFTISYKILRDYILDKKQLQITIIYSSTSIQKGDQEVKSVILQKFTKDIDIISQSDSSSYIVGVLYRSLAQKISNLINDELGK